MEDGSLSPKARIFPPEPYFQPSPGLAGLCPVRSPLERHRALWQPMARPGRLRLLHKHSSCSHTFSKGHGASFTRAERGGSGWSTQLLLYPAAIPAALGRAAAAQVSTGAFLLHLARPPRGRRAAGTALLPFLGAGRAGGSLHGALRRLQAAGEPPAAASCWAQTSLPRSGAAPGNHRASAVFLSPLLLPLKSAPTHERWKRKELEASALTSEARNEDKDARRDGSKRTSKLRSSLPGGSGEPRTWHRGNQGAARMG